MDIKIALEKLNRAFADADYEAALATLDTLRAWLVRGGFVPAVQLELAHEDAETGA